MRLLVHSNAPWCPTGYGVVAKNLLPRFKAMGHDVACFAFNGLYGGQLDLDGITMLPLAKDLWGRDKMETYYNMFKADIFLTILDVWAVPEVAKMNLRWVPYCPVDHEPAADAVVSVLKGAYRVASMTKSGQKLLSDKGIESTPIPHGVDKEVFKPLNKKEELKEMLGFNKTDFVIGIVAMNKGVRKNFGDMFDIAARMIKKHDNVRLYIHTEMLRPDGINLIELSKFYGLTNGTVITDQALYELGLNESQMAERYNAFDVTLMTTAGEGFGLPIIESQACGTPVITNDFTTGRELNAHPELVIKPGRLLVDALIANQAMTDIEKAVEAVELVYNKGSESFKDKCVKFTDNYTWDIVAKQWEKFFNEIKTDLGLDAKPEEAKPEAVKEK